MRIAKRIAVLAMLMIGAWCAQGQSGTTAATEQLFSRIMSQARQSGLHEEPLEKIMRTIGLQFLGQPYSVGLLDESPEEKLVVDLTQFDCVLYVEVVLAMAFGVAAAEYDFSSFRQRLKSIRYRAGDIDGYCSRLHYFTEWITDNQARGHVKDITRASGGVPLDKTLNFMSSHRDSYPRLAANDSLFRGIIEMERGLEGVALFHIPQDKIHLSYDALRDGDILALSTHINGLDVTHTGLAFAQPDGTFGMLHASTTGGVKVSPDLAAYVKGNKVQIGIVVARPVDPRSGQ